jgi:hypothetical protein
MKPCLHDDCNELAVCSEEYCWQHLSPRRKTNYPKVFYDLIKYGGVSDANFGKIEFNEIIFPDYAKFRNCCFYKAKFNMVIMRRADFRDSDFTKAIFNDCKFDYADFRGTKTSFRWADLRGSSFVGASLQNVNCTGADFRDTNLIDADLIGAMLLNAKLYSTRMNNTWFRKENLCNFRRFSVNKIRVRDEKLFKEEKGEKVEKAFPAPLWAKYVYSSLKNNFRTIGLYQDEKWARSKERVMERKRLFYLGFYGDREADNLALERWLKKDKNKIFESRVGAILKYFWKWFLTILGYGENPFIFLFYSFGIIAVFTLLFMFYGFEYTLYGKTYVIHRLFEFNYSELIGTLSDLEKSLYLSIVTFTTLGYGDAHPLEKTRIIAGIEALLGFFVYSSFVATFLKRLSDD